MSNSSYQRLNAKASRLALAYKGEQTIKYVAAGVPQAEAERLAEMDVQDVIKGARADGVLGGLLTSAPRAESLAKAHSRGGAHDVSHLLFTGEGAQARSRQEAITRLVQDEGWPIAKATQAVDKAIREGAKG